MLGQKVTDPGPALYASSGRRGECWEDWPHHCHCRDGRLPALRPLVGQDQDLQVSFRNRGFTGTATDQLTVQRFSRSTFPFVFLVVVSGTTQLQVYVFVLFIGVQLFISPQIPCPIDLLCVSVLCVCLSRCNFLFWSWSLRPLAPASWALCLCGNSSVHPMGGIKHPLTTQLPSVFFTPQTFQIICQIKYYILNNNITYSLLHCQTNATKNRVGNDVYLAIFMFTLSKRLKGISVLIVFFFKHLKPALFTHKCLLFSFSLTFADVSLSNRVTQLSEMSLCIFINKQ